MLPALPGFHAFTGCNYNPAFFKKDKQRLFKRLKKKEEVQKAIASLGDTSISSLTIFLSGLGAIFEFDLKKVIALSTLRQLGVIIFSLSIRLRKYDFFHLSTHATFKSILFICAGIIIHNIQDCQNIRMIGILLLNLLA